MAKSLLVHFGGTIKPMRLKIFGAVLLVGFVQSSFGAIITNGVFDISGTIYVTQSEATPVVTPAGTCAANVACIFWQDPAGTSFGKVDIATTGLPNGNIPLALAGNDAANISGLTNPSEIVGGAGFSPASFMTFNNASVTTSLLINFIAPGIFTSTACGSAPAEGQSCTLPGSLFNFVNNPPPSSGPCGAQCEATATWVLEGITNTPGVTWSGNFTSQFPSGTPYQTVFADLQTNGYVSNTFSAAITLSPPSSVPEPASLGLMTIGIGLIALGVLRRRPHAK
jgi:hypothetical protein